MTDDERLPDPLAAARALEPGSVVIIRSRESGRRAELTLQMKPIARERGLALLVAADPELVRRSGLAGLHLPEVRIGEAHHWRALRPDWLITVAVHSLGALRRVAGADAVLLAPVFATASHAARRLLSPMRANLIAGLAPVPVYALGGVDAANAGRLSGGNYAGIATVSAFSVARTEGGDSDGRHT